MSEILRGDTKVADVTDGKYTPGKEERTGFRLLCRNTVHEKWKITSDIEATCQILKPKCMYLVSTLLAIILCLNIEIIQVYPTQVLLCHTLQYGAEDTNTDSSTAQSYERLWYAMYM